MDAGQLLLEARTRASLSQREVAERAGTSQGQVARYERSSVSPTTATLDRLLAACGYQVRALLEPLLADVDARVDELFAGEVEVDQAGLLRLQRSLDDEGDAITSLLGRQERRGAVTWAFDGATALQLQGLACKAPTPEVAVVLDEAARWWLRSVGAQAQNARGWPVHWLDGDAKDLAEATRLPFFTMVCPLVLRVADALPATVDLAVDWSPRPVRVATVNAVEQHWPQHAELLARLRQRRLGESGPPAAL